MLYKADYDLLILDACNFNAQMMNQALTVQSVALLIEIIQNAGMLELVKSTNLDFS